jgi:magnesium transporter
VLRLHPLALEDTQDFGQRPKADVYDQQLLLVYFGASLDEGVPVPIEVHLHISGSFILSVHRQACRRFDHMRQTLTERPPHSEHDLVFHVVDALTDSVLDVLDQVADDVDAQESEVFSNPRARDRDRLALLRRSLGSLRRVLVIQRQEFAATIDNINGLLGANEEASRYWRDVGDHLWRAIDEVETSRDSLQGMLDTYTNEVQERLTIIATIFLPLTVLTGFFGQNFNWLINHIGSAATFWGLGVGGLVFSAAVIVFWLIRSGLYQPPKRHRARGRAVAAAPRSRA